jgi:hypothetical protein
MTREIKLEMPWLGDNKSQGEKRNVVMGIHSITATGSLTVVLDLLSE